MKYSKWLLIALIFSLSLSVKADPTKDDVTGTWYAKSYYNVSESTIWLVQLKEDNTYLSLKMQCQTKKLIWVDEHKGTWKLDKTALIQMPKTHSDFNNFKEAEPGETITLTDVKVTEDALSYKDANQKQLTFNRHDGFFTMRCSGMM